MKADGKLGLVLKRLKSLAFRVMNQLEFFPFTLLFALLYAGFKLILLRRREGRVCVGEVKGDAKFLARDVMLWLGRTLAGPRGSRFDVCLRLSREDPAPSLQDALSVALAFPRIRSIGLYWDSSKLADDLPLLHSSREANDGTVCAPSFDEVGSQKHDRFAAFLRCEHAEFMLPVAASRDAQTLLKRLAGAASAVCLNLPVELHGFADAMAQARPDIQFFHLSPVPKSPPSANNQSLFGWGLSLHERMALIQGADAYIGSFDELGCTALLSRRPAILLGGDADQRTDSLQRGEEAIWFPGQPDPVALRPAILQFLTRHLPAGRQ